MVCTHWPQRFQLYEATVSYLLQLRSQACWTRLIEASIELEKTETKIRFLLWNMFQNCLHWQSAKLFRWTALTANFFHEASTRLIYIVYYTKFSKLFFQSCSLSAERQPSRCMPENNYSKVRKNQKFVFYDSDNWKEAGADAPIRWHEQIRCFCN